MKQDMRAEFKKQFPIPKYINRLMVRHNYAQASAGWDAAWQHRQQELDAGRLEVERLRDLIGLSYGYLWHVNNEHGTPQRFYPPERAAYEARKLLRDTLTHEQRGQYINSVRELIDEALAAQQEAG